MINEMRKNRAWTYRVEIAMRRFQGRHRGKWREREKRRSLRGRRNVILPGQYYDAETGLAYNYMRDFDSATGRYVESDPIGLKGGVNTYSYVLNNPLWYVDPLGLAECDVDDMTELARKNNPDMRIVRPIWFSRPPRRDGSIDAGYISNWPFARPQINQHRYGGKLSPEMRLDLYNTIVHENWHADQPFIWRVLLDDESEAMARYEGDNRAEDAKNEIMKSGTGSCECKQK